MGKIPPPDYTAHPLLDPTLSESDPTAFRMLYQKYLGILQGSAPYNDLLNRMLYPPGECTSSRVESRDGAILPHRGDQYIATSSSCCPPGPGDRAADPRGERLHGHPRTALDDLRQLRPADPVRGPAEALPDEALLRRRPLPRRRRTASRTSDSSSRSWRATSSRASRDRRSSTSASASAPTGSSMEYSINRETRDQVRSAGASICRRSSSSPGLAGPPARLLLLLSVQEGDHPVSVPEGRHALCPARDGDLERASTAAATARS